MSSRRRVVVAVLVAIAGSCSRAGPAALAPPPPDPSPTPTTLAPTTTTTTTPSTTLPPTTIPPTTTAPPPPPSSVAPPETTTTMPAGEPEVLARGVRGPRTEALQVRLAELRFDPGATDGRFGVKTEQAVWAFQHTYGFPADGRVTAALWDAMVTAGPPEPLVPNGGPNRTEVSIERQVLYVYRDGQLALVTHISTGTASTPTPIGNFAYERRISGWRTSRLGELYNPVYFHEGYAVHGSPSVPNYRASHGCVRLPMHIAEYFPALVSDGDPIFVM